MHIKQLSHLFALIIIYSVINILWNNGLISSQSLKSRLRSRGKRLDEFKHEQVKKAMAKFRCDLPREIPIAIEDSFDHSNVKYDPR